MQHRADRSTHPGGFPLRCTLRLSRDRCSWSQARQVDQVRADADVRRRPAHRLALDGGDPRGCQAGTSGSGSRTRPPRTSSTCTTWSATSAFCRAPNPLRPPGGASARRAPRRWRNSSNSSSQGLPSSLESSRSRVASPCAAFDGGPAGPAGSGCHRAGRSPRGRRPGRGGAVARGLGAGRGLRGDLEAQEVPAAQRRGELGGGARVAGPGVLRAVGAGLGRLRSTPPAGHAEHAPGGPLDVRAQRGRRRVDVEHSTVAERGRTDLLFFSIRYAFPSGLVR